MPGQGWVLGREPRASHVQGSSLPAILSLQPPKCRFLCGYCIKGGAVALASSAHPISYQALFYFLGGAHPAVVLDPPTHAGDLKLPSGLPMSSVVSLLGSSLNSWRRCQMRRCCRL